MTPEDRHYARVCIVARTAWELHAAMAQHVAARDYQPDTHARVAALLGELIGQMVAAGFEVTRVDSRLRPSPLTYAAVWWLHPGDKTRDPDPDAAGANSLLRLDTITGDDLGPTSGQVSVAVSQLPNDPAAWDGVARGPCHLRELLWAALNLQPAPATSPREPSAVYPYPASTTSPYTWLSYSDGLLYYVFMDWQQAFRAQQRLLTVDGNAVERDGEMLYVRLLDPAEYEGLSVAEAMARDSANWERWRAELNASGFDMREEP